MACVLRAPTVGELDSEVTSQHWQLCGEFLHESHCDRCDMYLRPLLLLEFHNVLLFSRT